MFSNYDPRLTSDLFTSGQICFPIYLYGQSVEKISFSKCMKVNG